MKKILLSTMALCLCFSTVAFAEVGYVDSNATSYKTLSPDTAEISISIVTSDGKSMQIATQKNKELSDKVYQTMKSMISIGEGDYVKTSDYSAQPVYSYSSNKKNFERYEVSNRVIVHTTSINKIGAIIDKATSLGATNIHDLSFSLSTYDKQCDQLLSVATEKTRARADILAKAAGSEVTGVKSISANCNTTGATQRIRYNMLAKNSIAPESASMDTTPIETGVIKIYANVNASYFVK